MQSTPTVTRIYRAAIKCGDDYVTVEETITVPSNAPQDVIDQAVATGWAVYETQKEALDEQIARIRAEPHAPATEPEASRGQRKLIDDLAREVGLTEEDMHDLAAKHGVESWEALTKRQASALIDDLKADKAALERQRVEEAPARPATQPAPHGPGRSPNPNPDQLARAREALAEAHQRAGASNAARPGDRIRNPAEPATDNQLRALLREASKRSDRRLAALTAEVQKVVAGLDPVDLRSGETLAQLRLTKGAASMLLDLFAREGQQASSGRAA
jgi:hypothetical protein